MGDVYISIKFSAVFFTCYMPFIRVKMRYNHKRFTVGLHTPPSCTYLVGITLFQSKPFKLLIVNIIISEHTLKTPKDLKRYTRHVRKDWCTEMSTVSLTQHPSFP